MAEEEERKEVNFESEKAKAVNLESSMTPWEQHAKVISMPRFDYNAPSSLLQRSQSAFLISCTIKREKSATKEAMSIFSKPNSLDASDFDHTPFYCEENVYFLCKKLCSSGIADAQGSDLFVVFISNDHKQIPLWHQKASQRADGVILWDYHVICVQRMKDGDTHLVWDLDSSLMFPCPLATYVSETVRPSFQLFSEFQRFFRVVHAPLFLRDFASDRRHMKDSEGNWTAQPPLYEPIVAEDGSVHNLNEYLEIHAAGVPTNLPQDLMTAVSGQKHGVVIGEAQLEELFSQIP